MNRGCTKENKRGKSQVLFFILYRGQVCRAEKGEKMSNYLLISDAAKEVKVESHVLRYWEEELHLPIKRNELGHRYYTMDDVERFKQIKSMKERGLQLKAIKMILKDGKLDVLPQEKDKPGSVKEADNEKEEGDDGINESKVYEQIEETKMSIDILNCRNQENTLKEESKEEKAQRLQWLLQQLIRETLRENNQELCREIKESVVKELDYQFRSREEREEERERRQEQRSEEYYKKMDELLRKKSKKYFVGITKAEKKETNKIMDIQTVEKKAKKKRHSIF